MFKKDSPKGAEKEWQLKFYLCEWKRIASLSFCRHGGMNMTCNIA